MFANWKTRMMVRQVGAAVDPRQCAVLIDLTFGLAGKACRNQPVDEKGLYKKQRSGLPGSSTIDGRV